jgi:manganese oxidase
MVSSRALCLSLLLVLLTGTARSAPADEPPGGHPPGHAPGAPPAPPPGPAPAPPPGHDGHPPGHAPGEGKERPKDSYRKTITPNGSTLPWKLVDGVKVFHLIAEEVSHEFAEGLKGRLWGYNGQVHGPTIEAVEGDRVRIYVTNRLPAPTSIHWHGLHITNGMDGVSGLTQRAIEPGETFRYEFDLHQHGTFMYHSHHDEMVQMAMGLMGMLVIHPKEPKTPLPDRDFVILLSEWKIDPGIERPDPNEMIDFNVLTFNAKVFPATAPLVVKKGDRVRIRIGNLSATDHHPIHMHGGSFKIIETDGGQIPESAQWPETTVLVPVGSTRTVEFVATNPGDWALHCHMTHHTMNQMGHDIPNLVGLDPSAFDQAVMDLVAAKLPKKPGADESSMPGMETPKNSIAMLGGTGPFGFITMGGMFTVIKVREGLTSYDDPGWYAHPVGAVANPATEEDLKRDGIDVTAPLAPVPGGPDAGAAPPAPHPHGGVPGSGGHGHTGHGGQPPEPAQPQPQPPASPPGHGGHGPR